MSPVRRHSSRSSPPSRHSRWGCRSRRSTTSTSTRRSTTPRTSVGCSGPTASRCCPTGGGCPIGYHGRVGTIVADRSDDPAPARSAARRRRTRVRAVPLARHRARSRHGRRGRQRAWAPDRCAGRRAGTCTGCASSTTGRHATSSPTSTSRSARSSARASPRRSLPGWSRWRRWRRTGSPPRCRTHRSPTTSPAASRGGSTCTSRSGSTRRRCELPDNPPCASAACRSPTCTGPRPNNSPT